MLFPELLMAETITPVGLIGSLTIGSFPKGDSLQLQKLYQEVTAPGWRINLPVEYRQKTCIAGLEKQASDFMFLCADVDII